MDEFKTKALKVRDLYNQLQDVKSKPRWDFREHTEGLVGDVSDLLKLVMAKSDFRSIDGDLDKELSHELAECLWCVFVIADELGIDLDEAFEEKMAELAKKINEKINS